LYKISLLLFSKKGKKRGMRRKNETEFKKKKRKRRDGNYIEKSM